MQIYLRNSDENQDREELGQGPNAQKRTDLGLLLIRNLLSGF